MVARPITVITSLCTYMLNNYGIKLIIIIIKVLLWVICMQVTALVLPKVLLFHISQKKKPLLLLFTMVEIFSLIFCGHFTNYTHLSKLIKLYTWKDWILCTVLNLNFWNINSPEAKYPYFPTNMVHEKSIQFQATQNSLKILLQARQMRSYSSFTDGETEARSVKWITQLPMLLLSGHHPGELDSWDGAPLRLSFGLTLKP